MPSSSGQINCRQLAHQYGRWVLAWALANAILVALAAFNKALEGYDIFERIMILDSSWPARSIDWWNADNWLSAVRDRRIIYLFSLPVIIAVAFWIEHPTQRRPS